MPGGHVAFAARLQFKQPADHHNHEPQVRLMANHIYKITEIVGSSTVSIEDAIGAAIEKASTTLRNIGWFQVVETRGHVAEGKVQHYQVSLKLGFTLDD